jgi:hypothetical protein
MQIHPSASTFRLCLCPKIVFSGLRERAACNYWRVLRLAVQVGKLGVELGQTLEQDNREQNPDDADRGEK